jgi:hypothetical protein
VSVDPLAGPRLMVLATSKRISDAAPVSREEEESLFLMVFVWLLAQPDTSAILGDTTWPS